MKKTNEILAKLLAHLTKGHPIDGLVYSIASLNFYEGMWREFGSHPKNVSFKRIVNHISDRIISYTLRGDEKGGGRATIWWTDKPERIGYVLYGSLPVYFELRYAPKKDHQIGNHELEVLSRLAEHPEGLTSKQLFEEVYKPKEWSRGTMCQDLKRLTSVPLIIREETEKGLLFKPVLQEDALFGVIRKEYDERARIIRGKNRR
jgi:predicted transcriptional regulator